MTDTIPDKATNDQSEIMDSPQTAQEATQQPVQKTGYQAKWIVQDFFECLDWLYLPQCMAQSLMHVNWKKYWKKGGPRVAWEVIRSLTIS